MGSFKAQLLLWKLARLTEQKQRAFSRQEIVSKINEIKYLSAQKKVPKLTLRKEILHLENRLTGILELEKTMLKRKRQESAKVASLKRQIAHLKQQLAACQDKNLNQRVDKLSHLLGDSLAHLDSGKKAKLMEQLENKKRKKTKNGLALFQSLVQRLTMLKQELQIQAKLEKDPEKIKALEGKIPALSQKLKEYQDKHPECRSEEIEEMELESQITPEQVQHEIIFHESVLGDKTADSSSKEDQELEKELPLPPPPRMPKISP